MAYNFEDLLKLIEEKTGFKCHSYKERPLTRRIRVRMRALGLSEFSDYYHYLNNNPDEFKILLDTITINLSYFFRNYETFEYLMKEVLPQFTKNERIVLWSAGCAQGEEAYSLAIIAAEAGISHKTFIYATDIDDGALKKAEIGVYPEIAFQYTPREYLEKYFVRCNEGYRIKDDIKKNLQFILLDLFDFFPYGPCDLIMCRNVLIYMGRDAQSELVRKFYQSLKPRGYLVIGRVELLLGIPEAKFFKIINRTERVYQKI
ncbi:MAG: protein-glutamate O-methyltransferase CheR [candidate division WOR-3 bacterium]|nr:protein-glutamate O-methyltransferase CheR [candidate division WOR-3 bacterium]